MTLAVVCWKWKPTVQNYRSEFGPRTVNVLKNMLDRHLHMPFKFYCITDDPAGIRDDVTIVPLWERLNVKGILAKGPDCTRRLRLFDPDFARTLGDRILSLDLDVVITDDITRLIDRPEPLMFWGDTNPYTHYNGSMMLLTPGVRPDLYTDFNPETSLIEAHSRRHFGSDQAWISFKLGPDYPTWGVSDGIYSFRMHISPLRERTRALPHNAKIVFFHGRFDPWMPVVQRDFPWVSQHYR